MEFLDYMAVLFLALHRISTLFSIVTAPTCIATNSVPGFPSVHILVNTYYLVVFDNGHSDKCEVISHCGFDLHFSGD